MDLEQINKLQNIDEQSFLEILRMSFLNRTERNSSYSLRAFAKSLDVDPGLLSRILNRKRRPAKSFMEKVMNQLAPDFDQLLSASKIKKESLVASKTLGQLELKPIARWYFFLILDLFFLPDFESNEEWIAERTGLKLNNIKISLDVLEKYGHIDRSSEVWSLCSTSTMWTDFESTSVTRKNMQKQILEKAISAIDEVNFEYREASSLSLPMDKSLVPELKTRITKFKRELRQWIETNENYDEIYQFSFNFFPLTNIKENENED